MSKRKLGYWFGFGAIGLLLAFYLSFIVIPNALSFIQGKAFDYDIWLIITLGIVPITVIPGLGLLGARQDPHLAGTLEMVLGGVFLALALFLSPSAISFIFGLYNFQDKDPIVLFSLFFVTGSLLFASGRLFWKSAGKQQG